MNKVLVTGGCGFIGSALVKSLVKNGQQVVVLDNCSRGNASRLSEVLKEIEFLQGDIRNFDDVSKACKGVSRIHHLAYINGTENFYKKPDLVLDVAAAGITNLYNICKTNKIDEFYLASTSEVYQTPENFPANENERLIVPDVMNSRYSYGGGKILCELIAIHCIKKLVKKLIIYRPHNVYGIDMGNEHVIPQFFTRMKELANKYGISKKFDFPIQGTGEETRAFIYISDFIKAIELLIKKGKNGEIYHIGNSEEISIKELAMIVSLNLQFDVAIKPGLLKSGSTLRRVPDISKISDLGYLQTIPIKEGISRLKQWYSLER